VLVADAFVAHHLQAMPGAGHQPKERQRVRASWRADAARRSAEHTPDSGTDCHRSVARGSDTHFFLLETKRSRFTTVYQNDSTRHIVCAPDGLLGQGHYVEGPRRSFSGAAALLSTARDDGRFLQMMLNGGVLDGARVLAPQTVALMTSNQSRTLSAAAWRGFGLGFSTVEWLGADGFRFVSAYGWGVLVGRRPRSTPRSV
jgi:Beta-lactamase